MYCVVSWGWGGAVRTTIKSTSSPDDMGLNPHCGPAVLSERWSCTMLVAVYHVHAIPERAVMERDLCFAVVRTYSI
eukprot:jgi/Chrzof1/12608/Cz07g01010.t1